MSCSAGAGPAPGEQRSFVYARAALGRHATQDTTPWIRSRCRGTEAWSAAHRSSSSPPPPSKDLLGCPCSAGPHLRLSLCGAVPRRRFCCSLQEYSSSRPVHYCYCTRRSMRMSAGGDNGGGCGLIGGACLIPHVSALLCSALLARTIHRPASGIAGVVLALIWSLVGVAPSPRGWSS